MMEGGLSFYFSTESVYLFPAVPSIYCRQSSTWRGRKPRESSLLDMLCSCSTRWRLHFPSHHWAHLWGAWRKGNNSGFTHLHVSEWKISKSTTKQLITCRLSAHVWMDSLSMTNMCPSASASALKLAFGQRSVILWSIKLRLMSRWWKKRNYKLSVLRINSSAQSRSAHGHTYVVMWPVCWAHVQSSSRSNS